MAITEKGGLLEGTIAAVAVERALYSFDGLFDYVVPVEMAGQVQKGMRVIVQFGNGAKKCVGMVFNVMRTLYHPLKTKRILKVLDTEPVLDDELLKLAAWLKENTFCTLYDAVKSELPSGLGYKLSEELELSDKPLTTDLSDSENAFIEKLKLTKSKKARTELLSDENGTNAAVFASLLQKEVLIKVTGAKRRVGDETESMVRLSADFDEGFKRDEFTPKQRTVIDMLTETDAASIKEVCYNCALTPAVVKNLVKKGALEEYEYVMTRAETAGAEVTESLGDIHFSPLQQTVYDGLKTLADAPEPKCALLHGVTGSGKTSVFIKLIEYELSIGKTALMLVPEISLTPQMCGKFQRLFGNKVAIIHSSLSLGQRADEYKRIKSGDAKIVIGTRSAVFAPLKNIGIVVIDEEGEHSYKSDKTPRYHARTVAKQRCFYHKALLLLASATPSFDSYYNAKRGRYSLFEMKERYSNAVLPDVYMIDMKIEAENGNRGNFSEALLNELKINLENGEQSMLLLNRRGYHTYANCISCGAVIECPNCKIPLTYHKVNDCVICHYCGFMKKMPDKCERCGSGYIYQTGTGTQRIEDEIKEYFPSARILRMDADTTMSKNAFEKRFAEFGRGDYDIMVGTQMIAKGLDFANVTLVGVLLIDKSLYSGDYLGYERTFSLITQVVGRAGRSGKKGRAYLQTFTPEHYVLELAAQQNYVEFFEQEMAVRKELLFPPYCDLCLVGFSSVSEQLCEKAAKAFLALFTERLKNEQKELPLRILGPTKSGTARLNGRFRMKLLIKCKNNAAFRAVLSDTLKLAYKDKCFENVSFYADINGEI